MTADTATLTAEPRSASRPFATVRVPHAGIPGASILITAVRRASGELSDPRLSFFVDVDGVGAEWCPPMGPILIWYRTDSENADTTRAHHFYPRVRRQLEEGSHGSVDLEGLPAALARGDGDLIFVTLRRCAAIRSAALTAEG